jgi:hypothetical protein
VIWLWVRGIIWIAVYFAPFLFYHGGELGAIEGFRQAGVFGPIWGVAFISLLVVQPWRVEFVEVNTERSGLESKSPDLES